MLLAGYEDGPVKDLLSINQTVGLAGIQSSLLILHFRKRLWFPSCHVQPGNVATVRTVRCETRMIAPVKAIGIRTNAEISICSFHEGKESRFCEYKHRKKPHKKGIHVKLQLFYVCINTRRIYFTKTKQIWLLQTEIQEKGQRNTRWSIPAPKWCSCAEPGTQDSTHLSLLRVILGGSRLGFSRDSICGLRRK